MKTMTISVGRCSKRSVLRAAGCCSEKSHKGMGFGSRPPYPSESPKRHWKNDQRTVSGPISKEWTSLHLWWPLFSGSGHVEGHQCLNAPVDKPGHKLRDVFQRKSQKMMPTCTKSSELKTKYKCFVAMFCWWPSVFSPRRTTSFSGYARPDAPVQNSHQLHRVIGKDLEPAGGAEDRQLGLVGLPPRRKRSLFLIPNLGVLGCLVEPVQVAIFTHAPSHRWLIGLQVFLSFIVSSGFQGRASILASQQPSDFHRETQKLAESYHPLGADLHPQDRKGKETNQTKEVSPDHKTPANRALPHYSHYSSQVHRASSGSGRLSSIQLGRNLRGSQEKPRVAASHLPSS